MGEGQLRERALVPYFDAGDASGPPSGAPLQKRLGPRKGLASHPIDALADSLGAGQAQPRGARGAAGSPPKENQAQPGGKQKKRGGAKQPQAQPQEAGSSRKHHRDPSAKNLPGLAAAPPAAPPPRKRQEQGGVDTPPQPAGLKPSARFAGPAFTNSPMPDTLPIPTTGLLMHQAAERMQASLML